jgi:type IV pilus assembly protein PilV
MRHRDRSASSRGFTLIEVMVALVVISIGMLGIAKMQALGLSSTSNARTRSLAAIEAASLAAAMHANRLYWASALLQSTVTVTNSGTTSTIATPDAPLTTAIAAAKNCITTTAAAQCTQPIDMAAFDLQQWATALQPLLPNVVATIICSHAVPLSCVITLKWSENAVAINSQEAAQAATAGTPAAFQIPTYSLYVEP